MLVCRFRRVVVVVIDVGSDVAVEGRVVVLDGRRDRDVVRRGAWGIVFETRMLRS